MRYTRKPQHLYVMVLFWFHNLTSCALYCRTKCIFFFFSTLSHWFSHFPDAIIKLFFFILNSKGSNLQFPPLEQQYHKPHYLVISKFCLLERKNKLSKYWKIKDNSQLVGPKNKSSVYLIYYYVSTMWVMAFS